MDKQGSRKVCQNRQEFRASSSGLTGQADTEVLKGYVNESESVKSRIATRERA